MFVCAFNSVHMCTHLHVWDCFCTKPLPHPTPPHNPLPRTVHHLRAWQTGAAGILNYDSLGHFLLWGKRSGKWLWLQDIRKILMQISTCPTSLHLFHLKQILRRHLQTITYKLFLLKCSLTWGTASKKPILKAFAFRRLLIPRFPL